TCPSVDAESCQICAICGLLSRLRSRIVRLISSQQTCRENYFMSTRCVIILVPSISDWLITPSIIGQSPPAIVLRAKLSRRGELCGFPLNSVLKTHRAIVASDAREHVFSRQPCRLAVGPLKRGA